VRNVKLKNVLLARELNLQRDTLNLFAPSKEFLRAHFIYLKKFPMKKTLYISKQELKAATNVI
jgi:hypothetical protein